MTTLAGSPVSVSSDHATVDGSTGTYFTWWIDGNYWAGPGYSKHVVRDSFVSGRLEHGNRL